MKKYKLVTKQLLKGIVVAGDSSCAAPSCPAVIKRSDGKVILVGTILSKENHADIAKSGVIKFHDGEVAMEMDAKLFRLATGKI